LSTDFISALKSDPHRFRRGSKEKAVMAEITAQMVKELRERTGAGMMDCKNALNDTQGNMEAAVDALRKKGLAAAAKKAGRITAEGAVGSYIHGGGKIGVLVEVNCETDFVARTDQFQELVRDIAMHIAAADPRCVRREEVTPELLEREQAIFREQALASGKPAQVVEKIVAGKMEKYYSEFVLLEQSFVKNPDQTVSQMIAEKVAKIGENIQVRRFVRYKLGEGIEKRQDDFAAEVMAQAAR
jgi:elongation factor Ts